MKILRKILLTSVFVGVTVIVWISVSQLTMRVVRGQSISPVALTATIRETRYRFPSGSFSNNLTNTIAISGDGSRLQTYTNLDPGGRPFQMRVIQQKQKRSEMFVIDLIHALSTFPLSTPHFNLTATCGSLSGADTSTLNNVSALKIVLGGGDTRREYWRAPSLGCFELKTTQWHKTPDGKEMVTNILEVMELKLGEPDASLFSIPVDYQELPPSAVTKLLYKPYPDKTPPDRADDDKAYYAARARMQ